MRLTPGTMDSIARDSSLAGPIVRAMSADGDGPRLYLALGDAPADACLNEGCGKTARQNLYDDGVVVDGPFCNETCLLAWDPDALNPQEG